MEHLRGLSSVYTVTVADWERFDADTHRALIRAVIERIDVAKGGKGRDRLTFTLSV